MPGLILNVPTNIRESVKTRELCFCDQIFAEISPTNRCNLCNTSLGVKNRKFTISHKQYQLRERRVIDKSLVFSFHIDTNHSFHQSCVLRHLPRHHPTVFVLAVSFCQQHIFCSEGNTFLLQPTFPTAIS